jgi:hypothetical protein
MRFGARIDAMATRMAPGDLLADLDPPPVARAPLARWLSGSPRFAAFADEHRAKIRKKLRSADGAEGARDVLCELETAHAVLRDPRFALAYEAQSLGSARGPDFSLTYRTHTLCHIEVARLRGLSMPSGERLHDLIGSKLGQLLAGAMNVLAISTAAALPASAALAETLAQLQRRAERGDPHLLARCRFEKRADFFRFYARLSAIVLRSGWEAQVPEAPRLWLNGQARHPLPDDIARALHVALAPEPPVV